MVVMGATFVGPLPAEIQNYSVHGAGIAANSAQADAARGLPGDLTSAAGTQSLTRHGLERP